MRRIIVYFVLALTVFEVRAEWEAGIHDLIDKSFIKYVDSINRASDTIVYSRIKLSPVSTSNKGYRNSAPGQYFRPGYSLELPATTIYYTYNLMDQRHAFVLNKGGVIIINFVNSFDNYGDESIHVSGLNREEAIKKLEGLRNKLAERLELDFDEPYGTYRKDSLETQGFYEYYYDEFKYTINYVLKQVEKLLNGKNADWANNNIRVKKGMFVIDFLFIRDKPYELLAKVLTTFKVIELPDLDVEVSNEFIRQYYHGDDPKEMPDDNDW